MVFYRLLELAVAHAPVRYQDIIATRRPRTMPPYAPKDAREPANSGPSTRKPPVEGITTRQIRTTNPIESTFATIRLRHKRTKGNGSRKACLAMFYKPAKSAEKRWRNLNGHDQIPDVIAGVRFTGGVKQQAA